MLKYFKKMHDESEKKEITYDEALRVILGTWKDNDMTRDMLTTANKIHCMYSDIYVEEWRSENDNNPMVLMAGLCNIIPMGIEYDEDGNRMK